MLQVQTGLGRRDSRAVRSGHDLGIVLAPLPGRPLKPSNAPKRFKALMRIAGFPEQRCHDSRHCAASLLIAQGVPVMVAAEILRHSQLTPISDLYAHNFPAKHQDAAELMHRISTANA